MDIAPAFELELSLSVRRGKVRPPAPAAAAVHPYAPAEIASSPTRIGAMPASQCHPDADAPSGGPRCRAHVANCTGRLRAGGMWPSEGTRSRPHVGATPEACLVNPERRVRTRPAPTRPRHRSAIAGPGGLRRQGFWTAAPKHSLLGDGRVGGAWFLGSSLLRDVRAVLT